MTEQKNQLASLFAACWKDDALKQRFFLTRMEYLLSMEWMCQKESM
jgi:hypothetical protein